jgi:hypothetical protein
VPDLKNALASSYVEPRGTARQTIARAAGGEVLGAAGRAIAGLSTEPAEKSPISAGRIGFLAVFPEEIVLFAGKRGAFKPKPTEEILASVPRAEVASARLEKKAVKGVLTIGFHEGGEWEFDMPRVHLKHAEKVAAALS